MSLKLARKVKEDMGKMADKDVFRAKSRLSGNSHKGDPSTDSLGKNLRIFEKEFDKTPEQLADLFCKVSGRIHKVKQYLMYEKKQLEIAKATGTKFDQKQMANSGVVLWTYLEDLALRKPEDSPEFKVLKIKKGLDEIQTRREFLHATPIYSSTYQK